VQTLFIGAVHADGVMHPMNTVGSGGEAATPHGSSLPARYRKNDWMYWLGEPTPVASS
jgi:hypothetical protein